MIPLSEALSHEIKFKPFVALSPSVHADTVLATRASQHGHALIHAHAVACLVPFGQQPGASCPKAAQRRVLDIRHHLSQHLHLHAPHGMQTWSDSHAQVNGCHCTENEACGIHKTLSHLRSAFNLGSRSTLTSTLTYSVLRFTIFKI